ncbi:MAG: hypothetical protein Q7T65_12845 [Thiobacillus sp.]|nr:hypothetical protein [Thiobacillus sp.]
MTDNIDDLKKQGQQLYSRGANQVLAGFQLIEEMLKSYLELHFNMTRVLLNGRLYFEFRREDYQDAALGRLTQVFSKLCANGPLVSDLRAVIKRRDHIAHRALLKLYDEGITPQEYSQLIDELNIDMQRSSDIMNRIVQEMGKLRSE